MKILFLCYLAMSLYRYIPHHMILANAMHSYIIITHRIVQVQPSSIKL